MRNEIRRVLRIDYCSPNDGYPNNDNVPVQFEKNGYGKTVISYTLPEQGLLKWQHEVFIENLNDAISDYDREKNK